MPQKRADAYVSFMSTVYSTSFSPDPTDSLDVLAFVLCPASAFAHSQDPAEVEAVMEIIGPVKEEVLRRWQVADLSKRTN